MKIRYQRLNFRAETRAIIDTAIEILDGMLHVTNMNMIYILEN